MFDIYTMVTRFNKTFLHKFPHKLMHYSVYKAGRLRVVMVVCTSGWWCEAVTWE